jgi:hypothetical protein
VITSGEEEEEEETGWTDWVLSFSDELQITDLMNCLYFGQLECNGSAIPGRTYD